MGASAPGSMPSVLLSHSTQFSESGSLTEPEPYWLTSKPQGLS